MIAYRTPHPRIGMNRSSFKSRSSRIRLVSSAVVAVLSAGLLAGCQKPVSQDIPVRVGYSAWPGWFPWKVTEEKKLFEAEGVPVTLQWFDGYLDSINALNAGQLDCNSQTLNDTISSVAGGADLQVVLQNDFSTGNDQIIAAAEITSVAGLKGKKVAAEEGTVDHFLLLKVLKEGDLSASDIIFVPLETGAAAAAFAAGKVDAAGVYAPFTTQALKRPGSKALSTSKDHPVRSAICWSAVQTSSPRTPRRSRRSLMPGSPPSRRSTTTLPAPCRFWWPAPV